MFQVFDNDKPADSSHQKLSKGIGWDNSSFNTLDEARRYAVNYFYPYLGDPKGKHVELILNEPCSWYEGRFATIKEI